MTNPTPYDHTTPPPSPQTNSQSQTPQLSCAVTRPQATVKPRQTTPAAAYTPPCEGRTVARDGLFHALRKSSSCPSSKTSPSTSQHSAPKAKAQKDSVSPLTPLAGRPQRSPDEAAGGKPQLSLVQQFLMDAVPQISTMPKDSNPDNMSKGESKPKKTKLPALWTSKLRKPLHPSDIFNMSFSFSTPSRRRPSDHTPQISPRTSISSDSDSPSSSPGGSFKRQRIDSSDSNTTLKPFSPFSFSSPSPPHDSHGYIFGPSPSPNGPSGYWFQEHVKSFRPVATSAEAHPGFPVDFNGPSSPSNEGTRRKKDEQGYHDYLDEERRRDNSSPHKTRIFCMDMDDPVPDANVSKEDLNKQARILGLSSNMPNIKRASTMRLHHTRKGGAHSGSSSSASGSGSYITRTSSTMSDPSTDKFLTHVRASQEARALARTLSRGSKGGVFANEAKIWLGDDPL